MSDPSSTWLQSSVLIINVFECILFSYSLVQIVIRIKGLTTHFIFHLFIYLGIYVKYLYSYSHMRSLVASTPEVGVRLH